MFVYVLNTHHLQADKAAAGAGSGAPAASGEGAGVADPAELTKFVSCCIFLGSRLVAPRMRRCSCLSGHLLAPTWLFL